MGIYVNEWPQELTDTMVSMWEQGYNASQISQVIGYSRSAILGKLHRLRKAGSDTARKAAAPRKLPNVAFVPQQNWSSLAALAIPFPAKSFPGRKHPARNAAPIAIEPLRLQMAALTKKAMCRFICDGDGAEALYCGHDTGGGSWCPSHRAVVFA